MSDSRRICLPFGGGSVPYPIQTHFCWIGRTLACTLAFVCLFVYFFVRPTICFLSNFVISKLFLLISWHAWTPSAPTAIALDVDADVRCGRFEDSKVTKFYRKGRQWVEGEKAGAEREKGTSTQFKLLQNGFAALCSCNYIGPSVLPSCWPCVANAQKHSIAKDSGKLSNALNTLFRSSKNCQWRFATFINVSIRLKTFHTRSRTLATTSRKKAISFLLELWKAHKSFTPDWFNIV